MNAPGALHAKAIGSTGAARETSLFNFCITTEHHVT